MIKLLAASALLISIAFATQAQSGYLLRPTGEKISFESMKAGEQYLLKYITFSHEEVAKTIPPNKIALFYPRILAAVTTPFQNNQTAKR